MEGTKIYKPGDFETTIASLWDKEKVYATNHQSLSSKSARHPGEPTNPSKMYCLSMFPYPSGSGLHVGHVRIYTGTDVLARYFRMKGKNVLHPMGWDAFGLPAENAAIKEKKNPLDMVPGNIANFKRQMQSLGLSYDWEKELATIDPSYYKWTQWLFIQFFKKGLLYKKNTPINFCPKCKTGLAEEEVLANGTHERCGSAIVKKELPQWIFRITAYAERLLEDLKLLDWPKGILEMQKNWIGKKEGVNVQFEVSHSEFTITCFTTRIDTLYGVSAVVVAPEHAFAKQTAEKNAVVKEYIERSYQKTEIEREDTTKKKTGVPTGEYAVHPLTGKKVPVWVGDYVLGSVGTGAVMVVPAHDMRDFDFAKTYGIKIISVVVPADKKMEMRDDVAYEGEGIVINSKEYSGMGTGKAREIIAADLEKQNKGKKTVSYHLRDWIFSRQRYWGEPIPMIYCEKCGWNPVPENELPLKLPYTAQYEPTKTGESPLSAIVEFVHTTCPICHGKATRETDTMPNWAGSCWYFMAFSFWNSKKSNTTPIVNGVHLADEWKSQMGDAKNSWLPVDWYLGGAEHAVLHLLYARFWVKALQDMGFISFSEPFLKLRNVGMVLAEDHRKMSKSWGNTISPDDIIAQYGADSLRLYEMFMAPFNMEIAWSTAALQGAHRFIKRIWALYGNWSSFDVKTSSPELARKLNKTIEKVGNDIVLTKFNTAIAAMMEFLNLFEAKPTELSLEDAKKYIQLLAPFAPFITEKIWRDTFKETSSIHNSNWPTVDNQVIKNTVVIIPVQVNGKVRAMVQLPSGVIEQDDVVKTAKKNERIAHYLEGKQFTVIYVKGRILNFVV